MRKTINYYKKDIEKLTSRFITLIEPLFIAFIGLIVGFIVFSIMLPLSELNTFIR
ncbi:type II secretion system F family protein [Deferribacter abyssi]|uniref:type II secretion system F family protein n=1 Tax=Deferribacter abyssi TaxID=213806 RepID=UPI003C2F1EEE